LEIDRAVMELLDKSAVSYCVSLTKIDQLAIAERATVESDAEREVKHHTAAYPEVFATSALKTLGLDALKAHLAALAAI
jgi:GTP-binding protein